MVDWDYTSKKEEDMTYSNRWQLYSTMEGCEEANKKLDAAMQEALAKRDPYIITKLMHTPEMSKLGATDSEPRNEFYDWWEKTHPG
jgi:hypothetical protein